MKNRAITLCNRPFTLESVSQRETAVRWQTAVTHVRRTKPSVKMKRIKYRDQFFYKYAIMSILRHKKCLYNTLYIRYAGIVQRFVSTIELFHGEPNAMQSYTLRSEYDFFLGSTMDIR